MSDHRRPPHDPPEDVAARAAEDRAPGWAQLDDPPPSPEELIAAAQLAALLDGQEIATSQRNEPDVFALSEQQPMEAAIEALSMAHLLQHVEVPPALATDRRDAVEAMLLGLWDEGMLSTPASRATPAEASATKSVPMSSIEADARPMGPEVRQQAAEDGANKGMWGWLMGWLTPGPRLALTGAFAVLLTVASISTLMTSQYSPSPPHQAQTPVPSQATRVAMAAQLSGSPWRPGQNPFSSTRSSSQRLQRVLEHNSQSALDAAFSAQSQQHLYRLR